MSGPVKLDHIDTWVFDLDNTLYPADADIMVQVDKRMTEFVMQLLDLDHDAARATQKKYWHEYGATLTGLIANHDVDMAHFLDFVTTWTMTRSPRTRCSPVTSAPLKAGVWCSRTAAASMPRKSSTGSV